jgi:hypothetical protein
MDQGTWSAALKERKKSPASRSSLADFVAAAAFALVAVVLWIKLDIALQPLPYFAAYKTAYAATGLPIYISIGFLLPHLIAPIPSVLVMIMLGALLPGHWRQVGFMSALIQFFGGLAFLQIMLLGTRSGSAIAWTPIWCILAAPIVLYPAATCSGAHWVQTGPRVFWLRYQIVAIAACIAIAIYGGYASDYAAYTRIVHDMQMHAAVTGNS